MVMHVILYDIGQTTDGDQHYKYRIWDGNFNPLVKGTIKDVSMEENYVDVLQAIVDDIDKQAGAPEL